MTNTKARILSEAKFLRSWYYFELINVFGDVPVILEPLNSDQLQIPQSTTRVIFETVIEPDLIDAATYLPTSYSAADVGRATKGAATALLAKAYLFQQKWDKAAASPISEISIPLKADANINYVAIRYADVLLWYAEALNEQDVVRRH